MLEADKRRTVSVRLFWPGRILSGALVAVTIVTLVTLSIVGWRQALHPFGWWSPLLSVLGGLAPFVVFVALLLRSERLTTRSGFMMLKKPRGDSSHIVFLIPNAPARTIAVLGIPVVYAVVVPPLAPWHLWGFVISATLVPFIIYWLPNFDGFARTTRFHPYRPNPYVDVYDEPRSHLWLRSEPQRTPVQRQPADEEAPTRV
jgi:hypothetical protein